MNVDIVVPTIGRPTLSKLLDSLAASNGPFPCQIILVDDRRNDVVALSSTPVRVRTLRSYGRGPAAARNTGWRASDATWIAFLDDDVIVEPDWLISLDADLRAAGEMVGASQGRVRVPMPADRAATDWERNVGGLETAQWITADMAYRRDVLARLGGFDERFRRAYREDADLALRATAAGYTIAQGSRRVTHPVRPADPWISIRLQAGNADDVLMDRLHGRKWRERAGAGRGRWRSHALSVSLAAAAMAFAAIRKPKLAMTFAAGWLAATGEFAWRRIAPGPKTVREVLTMLTTSAVIPFAAAYHRVRGHLA